MARFRPPSRTRWRLESQHPLMPVDACLHDPHHHCYMRNSSEFDHVPRYKRLAVFQDHSTTGCKGRADVAIDDSRLNAQLLRGLDLRSVRSDR